MFRQPLERVSDADVLAKTVYDMHGRPLLRAGVTLTPRYVAALRDRGIRAVYVRDGLADDLAPEDLISEHVRATLTGHVAATFTAVSNLGSRHRDGASTTPLNVDEAADRLGEGQLALDNSEALVGQLHTDVQSLLSELLESETIAGLDSLKSHNEYTFQHSVDVAVLGVVLGRRLMLPEDQLHQLALGCLLHDIGKTYIDTALLDKPGPLTPDEFAIIQQHPRMGFELCRRLPLRSLLPGHVAYQHHERQQGGGYPRGLVGTNTVDVRTDIDAIQSGQMLLIAEIAAVADVYSALTSDRPYRDALPPDVASDLMNVMSGDHLNREVVAAMHTIIPRYPVGVWVDIEGGTYDGWRGVVAELHPNALHRPIVRIHVNSRAEAPADPPLLDLAQNPDVRIRCLARDAEPRFGERD